MDHPNYRAFPLFPFNAPGRQPGVAPVYVYLVFERKLTHLLRCFTKLKSSRTTVRSGFSFARSLHLVKFSSKHGFSVTHYLGMQIK
jgi:hypothetical protein